MLGKIFGVMCLLSVISATATGNLAALSTAALDGAARAVTVTLSLMGMMCLWCGVMRVFSEAGIVSRLARFASPLLRLAFPTAYSSGIGIGEIASNVCANFLGIGNAATPLAISAMKEMQRSNPNPDCASDDMITLAVLNCSSFCIFPGTLIALRHAAGSSSPSAVILPVMIASLLSSALSILLCRVCAKISKRRKQNGICGVARPSCRDRGAGADIGAVPR